MPTIKQHLHPFGGFAPQKPPLGAYAGHQLAKRSRVLALYRSQDKPAALSRRVLGAMSLAGVTGTHPTSAADVWSVPITDPDTSSQDYPIAGEARAVLRTRADLSPGCFLRLSVLYQPSGLSQSVISVGADYDSGGIGADVQVDVAWTASDGTTATTSHTVPMAASQVIGSYGAPPANPWTSTLVGGVSLMTPPGIDATDELNRWTLGSHAVVTVSIVGGGRIMDACLSEVPYGIAREFSDDGDTWISHMLATENPDGVAPNVPYPWQRYSEAAGGDPRFGSWHVMNVAEAQRRHLGPCLLSWTAYNEGSADVTSTSIPSVSTSSSTFVRLWDQVATDYDPNEPGFSTANFAQGYAENHPYLGGRNGSIPVMVAVHAVETDPPPPQSPTGTVRVQSAPHSWIDVPISTTEGWHYAAGHLEVGAGPGSDKVVQAFFRSNGGTGACEVAALAVYYHHPDVEAVGP